jgi:MoaD family protein
MRIRVKGFLDIRDLIGDSGEIDLNIEPGTLRELLDHLCAEYGEVFYHRVFNPVTNAIRPENPILVNGRHYRNLSGSLDTLLQEGDVVAIFPPVAGG